MEIFRKAWWTHDRVQRLYEYENEYEREKYIHLYVNEDVGEVWQS